MNTSDNQFSHLSHEALQLVNAPSESKITWVLSDKFIVHPLVKDTLSLLKRTLSRPRCERPLCWLLIGPPGSGKTALVNKILGDLGGDAVSKVGAINEIPLLVVEVPSRPTEPRLNLAIARELHMPVATESQSRHISDIILRNLGLRGVKMIIFIEMDHFKPLPNDEREIVFHFIKNITNDGISVVGIGTEACCDVIRKDSQLSSRFRPKYLHGFSDDDGTFKDFVHTLESLYPFPDPSNLDGDAIVSAIFKRTKGVVGETVLLLNEAAAWAIRQGRTKIELEAFQKCDYSEPLTPIPGAKA